MKEKIYLDTSIPSAFFDNRDKNRQKVTQVWWRNVLTDKYEACISELVEAELGNTRDKHRRGNFLTLVKGLKSFEVTVEAEHLAKAYIENDIVPEEYLDDALHLAIATVNGAKTVVSWNFTHMVNHDTKRKVKAVNLLKGYAEIEIESPLELGGGKYV